MVSRRLSSLLAAPLTAGLAAGVVIAGLGPSASAQEAEALCVDQSLDALGRRACYARALADAESDLNTALNSLRESARSIEAADRRRSALAAIDAAHNAWRLLRDHDCALRASLQSDPIDGSVTQMQCAISRTSARRFDIAGFSAAAPLLVAEGGQADPDADGEAGAGTQAGAGQDAAAQQPSAEQSAAGSGEEVAGETFRDWRAGCTTMGACVASSAVEGETRTPYAIAIARGAANQDWSVRLTATEARAHADAPIVLSIDERAPVSFQPRSDFSVRADTADVTFTAPLKTAAVFNGMRAGLDLTANFTDADGRERAERFSLRGFSAALDWIETQQSQ